MKATAKIWKGRHNSYNFEIFPKGQQWQIDDSHSMASTRVMAKKQVKKICKKLGIEIERIYYALDENYPTLTMNHSRSRTFTD